MSRETGPAQRAWLQRHHAKLACLLLVLFGLQVILAIRRWSPVYDEDLHIWAGYAYLTHPAGWANFQHPPLVKLLAGLPLLSLRPQVTPPPRSGRQVDAARLTHEFFRRNRALLDHIVFRARLPLVLLAAFLGWLLYRWTREHYGVPPALLALALFSFDPNILAHSGLVFMDMPFAAFAFLTLYQFWHWCQKPSRLRGFLTGLSLSLALLSKFPALILLPLLPVLSLLHHFPARAHPRKFLSVLRGLLGIYAVSLTAVLALYGSLFGVEYLARETGPSHAARILLDFASRTPGSVGRLTLELAAWIVHHLPIVGLEYLRGIYWQMMHAKQGMPLFLSGQHTTHAWWYFHLVTFLLKATLPLLLLMGLRVALSRRLPWQPPETFLLVPALATFLLTTLSPFGGGIRYLLVAYPCLFVSAGRLASVSLGPRRLWGALLLALLSWHAFSSIRIHPHYIAYFNEAVGGPSQGYRYLVGANLDFGQEVKHLAAYLRERGNPVVYASLHTTLDPTLYGMRSVPLPADGQCRTGTFAISATRLQGVGLENPDAFSWLKARAPTRVLGYAIFVYDVDRYLQRT